MKKTPFTPAEYDAATRELRRRKSHLYATSGGRDEARNAAVGGRRGSKHILDMADDYGSTRGRRGLEAAAKECDRLGLWWLIHDVGSGLHLHVQGLAPGRVPAWWTAKYGKG